jgi:hypothetical protein
MILRAALMVVVAVVATGCASAGPDLPDRTSGSEAAWQREPQELPLGGIFVGRPGPGGGTLLAPASALLDRAIPYRFNLGHCGLISPVDGDGSFWDALEAITRAGRPLDLDSDGEMINATEGLMVVIGDEARFRTASGSVVRFARQEGEKEFPGCD